MYSLTRSKIASLSKKARYYSAILISLVLCIYSLLFIPLVLYLIIRFRKKVSFFWVFIFIILFLISITVFISLKFIAFKDGSYKVISVTNFDMSRYVIVKRKIFYFSFYTSENIQVGDHIHLRGLAHPKNKYNPINNLNAFDFLFSKNISNLIKPTSIKIIKKGNISYLKKYVLLFPENIRNYFNIFFNYNFIRNSNFSNSLKSINLLYLFSFSAIHLFIIKKIIEKALFIINLKAVYQKLIIIIFFIMLYYLIGKSLVLVKFTLLLIINFLDETFNLDIEKIDKLGLCFIISTIFFPNYIFSLSYKIVYTFTFFNFFLARYYKRYNNLIKEIIIYFLFTFITLPIISQYINSYSIFIFFITPVLLYFFKKVFIPLLYISFLIYPISFLTDKIIEIINQIIGFIYIKNLTFPIPKFNIFSFILYYVVLILVFSYKNKVFFIKNILFLLVTILQNQFKYYINPFSKSSFFNVGQGNFTLVKDSFSKNTIVVDFFGNAKKRLDEMGVFKIDYLILTHSDKDHIGNISDFYNELKVETLIINNTDKYPLVNAKKIIKVENDFEINQGDIKLNFLKVHDKSFYKNNNSVCFMLHINNNKILFTGDIEKEAEVLYTKKYKQKLKCDILMVPHHGSSSSSTNDFVTYTSSKHAIISCGIYNKFNFPDNNIVKKYQHEKSTVYITYKKDCHEFYMFSGNIKYKKMMHI